MKGIVKLKVPPITVTPRLFVITLSRDDKQKKFSKVALSLEKAIAECWDMGRPYTVAEYINHVELTVYEINNLFKNFNP